MKKIVAILLTTVYILSVSQYASAASPIYTYVCAELTQAVTVDGVVSTGEWDDANALVINADNTVFQAKGQFQGGVSIATADLSVTYKMKWDDTNLYILEMRTDPTFFASRADALEPWNGDGTLFFFAVDNGEVISVNDSYLPFWVQEGSDGNTHVALRYYDEGTMLQSADMSDNWTYAAASAGNVHTIEIVIPFSDIAAVVATDFDVQSGQRFTFTPIIPNVKEEGAIAGSPTWSQLNFYDSGMPEDPNSWAGFVLADSGATTPPTGAPVTPAISNEQSSSASGTDSIESSATSESANPTTGDNTVVFAICILAALAVGGVIIGLRKFRNAKQMH